MSTFQTSDGLSLYYEDAGEGLPILCLAGLTRTTQDFDYVSPHLAGNRVIKLDYRGRGQSDWAEDWATYSLQVECRDVLELMAHLGLSKVAVIGTSRGGLNAMALAMGAPHALMGVALNDVGPVIDPGAVQIILTYLGKNPNAQTHEEAAAALEHMMPGFANMPEGFFLDEAKRQFKARAEGGLEITYDPKLRDATEAMAAEGGTPDLWPLFDALGLSQFAIRGDIAAGPGPMTMHLPGLPPVSPLICYEAIFPYHAVGKERPDWMVQLTNDAWFGSFAGPQQHYAQARIRAIEQGLPLVRAANTGISAVVDAYGREVVSIELHNYKFVDAQLPAPAPVTLYSRWGDWLAMILIVILAATAVFSRQKLGRH